MRLDTTEGKKEKKRRRGTGEQRKTDANRHGARGLRKLREARAKKPTNFVPGMSTARERTTSSRCRNEDGTFPQRRRWERMKKGRKEGRKGEVGGAEEAREGDESIRVSPRSI